MAILIIHFSHSLLWADNRKTGLTTTKYRHCDVPVDLNLNPTRLLYLGHFKGFLKPEPQQLCLTPSCLSDEQICVVEPRDGSPTISMCGRHSL